MKITVISGSHRREGQSLKVAKHIQTSLREQGLADEVDLLSLSNNPIPLWDEAIWQGDAEWKQRLQPIAKGLLESDAFVVIAPEYHGMVPPGLKNFFMCFGKDELAHKPALIVAVSAGTGGSCPVAELRMSSYKNCRICYLPEHIIVRQVESVLNADAAANNPGSDKFYRDRINWALRQLAAYAVALKSVRDSGVIDFSQYGNGM